MPFLVTASLPSSWDDLTGLPVFLVGAPWTVSAGQVKVSFLTIRIISLPHSQRARASHFTESTGQCTDAPKRVSPELALFFSKHYRCTSQCSQLSLTQVPRCSLSPMQAFHWDSAAAPSVRKAPQSGLCAAKAHLLLVLFLCCLLSELFNSGLFVIVTRTYCTLYLSDSHHSDPLFFSLQNWVYFNIENNSLSYDVYYLLFTATY